MAIVEGGRTTHTTLECKSVADSLRFYRDVMGLRVHQSAPGVGHVTDSKGQYTVVLRTANPGPQPFLNFYARPVADAAAVDAVHARIAAVRDEHRIAELTAPAREDPASPATGSDPPARLVLVLSPGLRHQLVGARDLARRGQPGRPRAGAGRSD